MKFTNLNGKEYNYTPTWEPSDIEVNEFQRWLLTEEGADFDLKITEIEQKYGHQEIIGW